MAIGLCLQKTRAGAPKNQAIRRCDISSHIYSTARCLARTIRFLQPKQIAGFKLEEKKEVYCLHATSYAVKQLNTKALIAIVL